MQETKLIYLLAVIAMIPLSSFALQLPEMSSPTTLTIAYASTNVTGNNETENIPNLITTPPPLISSIDQRGKADLNNTNTTQRTNAIQIRPSTGNYTNGTALVIEGPKQIITDRPAMGQGSPQDQLGQNIPDAATGASIINIPNINITKEQASKAEQEASVMIKAYYERLEQEKQKEKEAAAAAALAASAAVQSNQTAEEEVEDTLNETQTGAEEEEEEEESQENQEDSDNENGDNGEEEEDNE